MERLTRLFALQGRATRREYWEALALGASAWLVGMGLIFAVTVTTDWGIAGFITALIPMAMGSFAWAVTSMRRLRDRNRSPLLFLVLIIGPKQLWSFARGFGGVEGALYVKLLLMAVAIGLAIWGIVELGVLRGTAGPNRYGDDPLGPSSAEVFS